MPDYIPLKQEYQLNLTDEVRQRLKIMTVKDIKSREWLIEGLLPKNSLMFIGGDAGIGKTCLALQMATCLISGMPFLGITTKQSSVIFWELDESPESIKDKIEKLSQVYPALEWLPLYFEPIRIDQDPYLFKLFVGLNKPDVLFIDSFSAIHYQNENESYKMRPILDCLREVANSGTTIVALHHYSRVYEPNIPRHIRGSTVIEALSDFIIGMDRKGNFITLTPLKFRAERLPIQKLRQTKNLAFVPAHSREAEIIKLIGIGKPPSEIINIIVNIYGDKPATVKKAIQRTLKKQAQINGDKNEDII